MVFARETGDGRGRPAHAFPSPKVLAVAPEGALEIAHFKPRPTAAAFLECDGLTPLSLALA